MSCNAPQIPNKRAAEVRNAAVSFLDMLDADELLTGTPTVTEVTTTDLTFASVVVSTAAKTIDGDVTSAGKAVQFKVSGGTAGSIYTIIVACDTTSTPPQELSRQVMLEVC